MPVMKNIMFLSKCAASNGKKWRFIKKQEANSFFSQLGIKTKKYHCWVILCFREYCCYIHTELITSPTTSSSAITLGHVVFIGTGLLDFFPIDL